MHVIGSLLRGRGQRHPLNDVRVSHGSAARRSPTGAATASLTAASAASAATRPAARGHLEDVRPAPFGVPARVPGPLGPGHPEGRRVLRLRAARPRRRRPVGLRPAGERGQRPAGRPYDLVDGGKITPNFVLPNQPNAQDYSIDYRIEGKRGDLFLMGIGSRDKARLATIILEHWLRYGVDFDSLLVFQDQQDVPRADLARLSNAGGEMVASLDAVEDFKRKLTKLVA